MDVFDSEVNAKLGLTGKFLTGTFAADKHTAGPIILMAPLGIPESVIPGSNPPVAATPPKDPVATGRLPEAWILTLSAPENLLVDRSGFNAFRSGMVAEYKPLAEEGSWLKDDFWKTMAESRDDLLGNFAALGLDQIGQQDQEMLWQAMTPPEHPASVAEMTGNLADTFLICHGSTGKPPIIEEMRIRQTKNKLGEVGAIIYKQPLPGSQKSFFLGHAIGSQPMAR